MSRYPLQPIVLLALAAAFGPAAAESSLTLYGRVDLSLAQQADAPSGKELRNGSGSRFGVRGVEDLGGGLKAVFHLEHRFNADDGSASSSRFWEGKSVVGLEGGFGRITLGRDENPAYTFSQSVADPWGTDTVASNGSIVNGRIGSTRYSNSINYRYEASGLSFGAQTAEADDNLPASGVAQQRPYSLGLRVASGAWAVGLGYENPADRDDHWLTANASWDFGPVKVGALVGSGKNVVGHRHRAVLVSATAPLFGGELRTSYGQLEDKDSPGADMLDKQYGVGFWYPLSRRTAVYVDLVREQRDAMPGNHRSTGYDLGLRMTF